MPQARQRRSTSHYDYFLLRMTSRSSGGISHLSIELSDGVKAALEEALKEVAHAGLLELDERHLLLGLLQTRDSRLRRALLQVGLEPEALIGRLRSAGDD